MVNCIEKHTATCILVGEPFHPSWTSGYQKANPSIVDNTDKDWVNRARAVYFKYEREAIEMCKQMGHDNLPCDCDSRFGSAANVVGKITFNSDPINPPHYTQGGVDTFEFIKAKALTYEEGNIIKYVTRSRHKGKRLEDLKKAEWFLKKLIEEAEEI